MTLDITLIHSIGKIMVAILLLLALFLFSVDSQIKRANRLFAAFLILVAFDMCGLFMYEWLLKYPWVDLLRRSSAYLQMPLFYLYVKHVCFRDQEHTASNAKHGLLFVVYWGAMLLDFAWLAPDEKASFLQNPNEIEFVVFSIIGQLQYFCYVFLMVRTLLQYKACYEARYTNDDITAHRWLFQLIAVSVASHCFALLKDVAVYVSQPDTILIAYLIVSVSALLAICWIVLMALHHPSIARGVTVQPSLVKQRVTNQRKSKELDSAVSDAEVLPAEIQYRIDQLDTHMLVHEPFLDPDLSIEQLANELGEDTKELSTLINQHMGQNFFTYVNQWRIKKAQVLLRQENKQKLSVLEVLYDVGFNSKSSFNTAFKKYTGLTPSAYRKITLNKT